MDIWHKWIFKKGKKAALKPWNIITTEETRLLALVVKRFGSEVCSDRFQFVSIRQNTFGMWNMNQGEKKSKMQSETVDKE